jgi:hypothetical protein
MELITIRATCGNIIFSAEIAPADIPMMLDAVEAIVDENDLSHDDARIFVIEGLESMEEIKRTEFEQAPHAIKTAWGQMAATLLWLACRAPHPSGDIATRIASAGGETIEFEITEKDPDTFNFRMKLSTASATLH